MSKYTAEDFTNARFAEHPNPEDVRARFAARMNTDPTYPWLLDGVPGNTDEAMALTGWVIVPTKPAMTESRVKKMVGDWAVDEFAAGFALGFRQAGGRIILDPEPTNAEKLADIYREWCGRGEVPNSLIRFMDEAGVTAPEETK